jgi:hypothetical protein
MAAGRVAKIAERIGKSPANIEVMAPQKELLECGAYLRVGEEAELAAT